MWFVSVNTIIQDRFGESYPLAYSFLQTLIISRYLHDFYPRFVFSGTLNIRISSILVIG